jgi:hypothetical protein
MKFNRKETTACQETTEARLEVEEPASVDMTLDVADNQEVPMEDAAEMPAGEPRKRRRDRRNLPRCAARRKRTESWARGVEGRNKNEPREKMGD